MFFLYSQSKNKMIGWYGYSQKEYCSDCREFAEDQVRLFSGIRLIVFRTSPLPAALPEYAD